MRRIALALLALLLLSACAPSQAPEPAKRSRVQQPVSQEPAVRAADLRAESGLTVQTARPTRLYTGPGPFYLLIRELPEGTAVIYLDNREGWLRVRTPQGETGWLQAADAAMTDSRGQPVTYRIESGQWLVETASGLTVAVSRPGTGALRLTVTGLGATDPEILPLDGGS
ncbi:MAG TPA: SH3 domain-containing protein, partial [Symbiobacteriaceae bacterium]|nr:SH3 domain-containing protein [Symbiobacteriaceae bacterium]